MRGLTQDGQGQQEDDDTGTIVSQTTTLPPSASVAAIHYGHVDGEPWDRETMPEGKSEMSINMVGTKVSHYHTERLLIDSGAQCCVCPKDYAPEIGMQRQGSDELPGLHTVTG